MNFKIRIPERVESAINGLNQMQLGVLVGSGALVLAGTFLRLGLSGEWGFENLMISAGLLLLDVGAAFMVHFVGKRRRERQEQQRAYQARRQELDVVIRKAAASAGRREENEAGLARDNAELELRQSLDFDLEEKRRWAASMAISGYISGINSNRAATRPERKIA